MKLLLVEDSPMLQLSLSAGLRNTGNTVDQAFDGVEALQYVKSSHYDVVVLDLMLPKLSGLEVLVQLRKDQIKTPILILSAMDQVEDRIIGLDTGADDYLIKPFSFEELCSRLRALERRSKESSTTHNHILMIANVKIDQRAKKVTVNDVVVDLTRLEYALLELLSIRRGQTFSHDHLIERLYSNDKNVTRNAVEAHVSGLRRKIRLAGASNVISTRRGFGYYIDLADCP